MLTATDVRTQLATGDTNAFICLSETSDTDRVAETLVALANCVGGTLIIGVAHQEVVGVQNPASVTTRLIEAALATEPPLIIPLPQTLAIHDETVVITQIPAGMPHVYSYQGRYLTRQSEQNQPLNPLALRRLMIERGEISFEANLAQDTTLDDIDWEKARAYAENMVGFSESDVQQVLLKRGCVVLKDNELYPTNAGLLLFGKDPQRFLVGSDISAVRFASTEMSDTFNRQDIGGTLPQQIKRTETFLVDHLRKNVALSDRMMRAESYEYPMEAARELVVNAVAHRDYSINGDNIRVFLFSNRMEVYSPGRLPGPVTVQNIKDERFSRNPIIVQVLADLHFIEKLGYGVDRVLELVRAQNLQEPDFHELAGGFRVTLSKPENLETTDLLNQIPQFDFRGAFRGQEINARQEAAIAFLLSNAGTRITNSDLKDMFADVHPETIRRDLADLVDKDIFKKMGQKRGSYYILTDEPTDD